MGVGLADSSGVRATNNSERGFTLIELMIVLAIVSIVSILAIGTLQGQSNLAKSRQASSDIQTQLLRARSAAVRTNAMQKVCIYRDPDPTDAVNLGQTLRFNCFNVGDAGCPTGNICSDVDASNATKFDSTKTTCVAGMWCPSAVADDYLDLSGTPPVSVYGFGNMPGAALPATARNAVEITYGPNGLVDTRRSTAGYFQGTVYVSSTDFCSTAACSAFTRMRLISYTFGGTVRVEGS